MIIREILHKADTYCPPAWAESWDACGLQVGDTERDTEGVLVCLDVDDFSVSDAIANRCGLLLSHHPLLFDPLRVIDETTPEGETDRTLRTGEAHGLQHAYQSRPDPGRSFRPACPADGPGAGGTHRSLYAIRNGK
jgi:hypothetical protein